LSHFSLWSSIAIAPSRSRPEQSNRTRRMIRLGIDRLDLRHNVKLELGFGHSEARYNAD
jgi:hypothetical protein